MTKRRAGLLLLVILVATFFLYDFQPALPRDPQAIEPSTEALRIHHEAIVVDLHVDSLLWPRDLTRTTNRGHLDFPRMKQGGLDAAAFTIPTRFFRLAGLKAIRDLQPPSTWFSCWKRYQYQVASMKSYLVSEEGQARIATTQEAIRANHRDGALSILHGIEGAHALEGDLSRVRRVAEDGVLFIGPVHLWANDYGASSFGPDRGLTELGRRLILEMNRAGLLVDLAHTSPATFREALELTALPPIVSHTGVRSVHDSRRNLTDDQIRAVADRGGVIGVMLVPPGLSRPDLQEAFEHLAHLVAIGGEDAVALGSDFDGSLSAPIDVSGIPLFTELMLRAGWSEPRIKKILGGNVLRVLGKRKELQSQARNYGGGSAPTLKVE